jgi:hypothetical protein
MLIYIVYKNGTKYNFTMDKGYDLKLISNALLHQLSLEEYIERTQNQITFLNNKIKKATESLKAAKIYNKNTKVVDLIDSDIHLLFAGSRVEKIFFDEKACTLVNSEGNQSIMLGYERALISADPDYALPHEPDELRSLFLEEPLIGSVIITGDSTALMMFASVFKRTPLRFKYQDSDIK